MRRITIKELFSKKVALAVCSGLLIALLLVATVWGIEMNKEGLAYQDKGITIKWLPDTVTRWNSHIIEQAKKYNIDPNFVAIIMTLESGGYSRADSGFAQGLMQVTPGTGKDIATKYVQQKRTEYNLFDPATSIEFGVAYIAYLRNHYCDHDFAPNWNECAEAIAAGYNGGPGALITLVQGKGLTAIETLSYSRDAMNMWRERAAATSPTYERWKERGGQTLVDKAHAEKL